MPFRNAFRNLLLLIRLIRRDLFERDLFEMWQLVRPALGYAIVAGLLMAIVPALKLATAPGEDTGVWAQRVAGSYGGLLAAALYLSFVAGPLIVGIIVAWQCREARPGWLTAGLVGIIGGFPPATIVARQQLQVDFSVGESPWLILFLVGPEPVGGAICIGALSALFGFVGALAAVHARAYFA
jgi:hypothetical protein